MAQSFDNDCVKAGCVGGVEPGPGDRKGNAIGLGANDPLKSWQG